MNSRQQCEAICVTHGHSYTTGERCREPATKFVNARWVCWVHEQALRGPRYEKGGNARYSPVEFAKRAKGA